jgi:hypothetical protein
MWIVNGPASIVPLDGEGMDARKVTGRGFCTETVVPAEVGE